jgi:LPS-assembly protein
VEGPIQAYGNFLFSNRGKRLLGLPENASIRSKRLFRASLLFITITLAPAMHQHLQAQAVARQEPPSPQQALPSAPTPQQSGPQTPQDNLSTIPQALVFPAGKLPDRAILESDIQSRHGNISEASGNVTLTYQGHLLRADSITFNEDTGEANAIGHVELTGGDNDEHLTASGGTYNIQDQTGRFYDVNGSVGLSPARSTPTKAGIAFTTSTGRLPGYQNDNPFLFQGRMVVKTGPENYTIYNGSVTTCLLPHPDWQLFARRITLDNGEARASKSTFKLIGVPLLFLPYVTHPVDAEQRQSGFVIPELAGFSTASKNTGSKGFTFGEQIYFALGRSADLTVGSIYYSLRGFAENGAFRYRGPHDDFFNARFSALQDRGFHAPSTDANGNPVTVYVNQGGEDILSSFRHQFSSHLRAVGDAEYLSSYVYREAFTENFNQAVSTDITSILYLTDQVKGFSLDARVDRYEGLKIVPTNTTTGEEVKIFHVPSLDFTGLDHHLGNTPLLWSVTASSAGLKRVQPDFATAGVTERFDLRPELSLPLGGGGWHTFSSIAVRETAYSRQRAVPYTNGAVPIELNTALSRSDVDFSVDIRPPVVERTFQVPVRWQHLFGDEVRHTVEPEITYRNVHGINNFLSVLRFDDTDLASNTNEIKYGVTQHLYFRPHSPTAPKPHPGCPAKPASDTPAPEAESNTAPANDANGIADIATAFPTPPLRTHARHADPCAPKATAPPQREAFSWTLAQKHFFDQTFGGAVIDQRRNIFDTTLSLSGIAFLTEPRSISPLVSQMRFRTSSHADLEWDFDYDTGAKRFTRSNTFLDLHEGRFFGGFSYARLNAPGRFYSEVINTTTNQATGLTSSAISNFSQMRVLLGYGTPSQPGLSIATSTGIDLSLGSAQYITIQTSYNWNCCGISAEYRKYNLGTVRDEDGYRFNFTLANIGTAGNLRRAESLF